MGQPAYKVNEKDRTIVQIMAASGWPIKHIGQRVGVHQDTIRRHYKAELDEAREYAAARMKQALFENGLKGNVAAQIFWLKNMAGWRDRPDDSTPPQLELGQDNKQVRIEVVYRNAPQGKLAPAPKALFAPVFNAKAVDDG